MALPPRRPLKAPAGRGAVPAKPAPAPARVAAVKPPPPQEPAGEEEEGITEETLDDEAGGAGPVIAGKHPARPKVTEDNALALQEFDEEEPGGKKKKQKRFRPVKRPEVLLDRPTDIGDTSRFLIFGGIVLVVVVLAGVWYLFSGGTPKPLRPPGDEAPAKTASNTSSSTPSNAEPDYTLNSSNRSSFFGVMRFLDFGRGEGLEWNSTQLLAKFKSDVPATGVNDPEVREIHAKTLEMLNLGLTKPMQPHRDARSQSPDLSKERELKLSNAAKQHDAIMDRVKGLAVKLKRRYGLPPAVAYKHSEGPPPNTDPRAEAMKPELPVPEPGTLPPERPAVPMKTDDLFMGK